MFVHSTCLGASEICQGAQLKADVIDHFDKILNLNGKLRPY